MRVSNVKRMKRAGGPPVSTTAQIKGPFGPDGPSTAELLATTGQISMADCLRWLGHAARKPINVMVKKLLFALSIPGQPGPTGRFHLMGWTQPCISGQPHAAQIC